jgi:hypothetical protein
MSQRKFSGRAIMAFVFMVVSILAIVQASRWPYKTALFPISVGIVIFLTSSITLILILTGKGESSGAKAAVDLSFAEGVDEVTAKQRTKVAFAWIVGFILTIYLFGFNIAAVVGIFSYCYFQGKEKLWISIALACIASFIFWGLFQWLMEVPMLEGVVIKALHGVGAR